MARVDIEERAWSDSKLKRLEVGLGVSRNHAIGLLACLWHDSQSEGKVTVTDEDLGFWFDQDIKSGLDVPRILVASGYIEKTKNGDYTVCGNASAIARVNTYKERAKKANTARWGGSCDDVAKKKDEKKQQVKDDKPRRPTRILEDKHQGRVKESPHKTKDIKQKTECITLLRNVDDDGFAPVSPDDVHPNEPLSCQAKIVDVEVVDAECNASENDKTMPRIEVQGRGRVSHAPTRKNASESTPGVGEVIGAYCRAYKAKFNKNPSSVRMGKELAAAKTLTKSLGVTEAIRHIDAFLQMNDQWFIKTGYKLSTLCDNVNNVGLYLERGVMVTGGLARSAELHASNKAVADRMIAQMKAEEGAGDATDAW